MKIKYLIIGSLSMAIVNGCGHGATSVAGTEPPSLVLLLCDLTTSIDSLQTMNKVINNADKVLVSLRPNTKYMVNPIGQTPDQAIYEGETEEHVSFDKVCEKNRDKYDACLQKIYNAYSRRKDSASCIIDAVQAAAGTIIALQQSHIYNRITLIILSDMLEACIDNGVRLDLERKNFDSVSANRVIKRWPVERQFLAGLDSVNIYVVFNTSKRVSYSSLSSFWASVFKRAGYHRDVHFITDFRKEYLNQPKSIPIEQPQVAYFEMRYHQQRHE